MADSLTVDLRIRVKHTYSHSVSINTPQDVLDWNIGDTLANGTGPDQADVVWTAERTLNATSEELDLAGTLENVLGATCVFVKVRTIVIKNTNLLTGKNLVVGGAAANAWPAAANAKTIGPNGFEIWHSPVDGLAVNAGTGDKLKIDAGANNITYQIAIYGSSALSGTTTSTSTSSSTSTSTSSSTCSTLSTTSSSSSSSSSSTCSTCSTLSTTSSSCSTCSTLSTQSTTL